MADMMTMASPAAPAGAEEEGEEAQGEEGGAEEGREEEGGEEEGGAEEEEGREEEAGEEGEEGRPPRRRRRRRSASRPRRRPRRPRRSARPPRRRRQAQTGQEEGQEGEEAIGFRGRMAVAGLRWPPKQATRKCRLFCFGRRVRKPWRGGVRRRGWPSGAGRRAGSRPLPVAAAGLAAAAWHLPAALGLLRTWPARHR